MADARFRIVFAGPHVAFQDGGRPGLMRFGVTRSGPMDSLAHAAANLAVGRPADATAVEVSLGGLVLDCVEGAVTLAVAGGGFVVAHVRQFGVSDIGVTKSTVEANIFDANGVETDVWVARIPYAETRTYVMRARADATAQTKKRILESVPVPRASAPTPR